MCLRHITRSKDPANRIAIRFGGRESDHIPRANGSLDLDQHAGGQLKCGLGKER
jgi:hypothetical protein